MKVVFDESIYLGLVRRVHKNIMNDVKLDGTMPAFEKILSEMTGKIGELPGFENIEPLDDTVHSFMVDDVEDQNYSYLILRKGFKPKTTLA